MQTCSSSSSENESTEGTASSSTLLDSITHNGFNSNYHEAGLHPQSTDCHDIPFNNDSSINVQNTCRPLTASLSAIAIRKAVSQLYHLDDFIVNEKSLGVGYFATVHLVRNKTTDQLLAMKTPNDNDSQHHFMREIQLMNDLNHENILKFYGMCINGGRYASLTEFVNGGCLTDMLRQEKIALPWRIRVKLSKDIAEGIKYLHSKYVIHRDLSSQNILIRVKRFSDHENYDEEYTGVVADLGLCLNLKHERADRTSCVGNPYYTAPECLKHVAPYSTASDVFAYGLLLCEIVTRKQNDGVLIPRLSNFGVDYCNLAVPSDCPEWFLELAYACCLVHAAMRPSIDEVCTKLELNQAFVFQWPSRGTSTHREEGPSLSLDHIHYPDNALIDDEATAAEATTLQPSDVSAMNLHGSLAEPTLGPRSARLVSDAYHSTLPLLSIVNDNYHVAMPSSSEWQKSNGAPSDSTKNDHNNMPPLMSRRRRYSTESLVTHHVLGRKMASRDPCYIHRPLCRMPTVRCPLVSSSGDDSVLTDICMNLSETLEIVGGNVEGELHDVTLSEVKSLRRRTRSCSPVRREQVCSFNVGSVSLNCLPIT